MIISLTSFPARIPYIAPCLESLVVQIDEDDRIVLWLGDTQFPNRLDDLPESIRKFAKEFGGKIEFRFTEDIRAFTKLLPSLHAFPNETIITVDDDIIYGKKVISALKEENIKHPNAILAHAVSDLFLSHGELRRTSGEFGFRFAIHPLRIMLGMGAVLYPPHSLGDLAIKSDAYKHLTPTNDDLWFWYCAAKANTPILRVPHPVVQNKLVPKAGTVGALSAINETDGDKVNRENLTRIINSDPEFARQLNEICRRHRVKIAINRLLRLLFHYPRQAIHCLKQGGWAFLKTEIRRLTNS